MTATALIEALRAAAASGDREAGIFLPRFADWFVRSAKAHPGAGHRWGVGSGQAKPEAAGGGGGCIGEASASEFGNDRGPRRSGATN